MCKSGKNVTKIMRVTKEVEVTWVTRVTVLTWITKITDSSHYLCYN